MYTRDAIAMDYRLLRYEATQLLLNSAALNSEHYKHQNCPQLPLELRCEQFSDSNFYHLTSAAGLDSIYTKFPAVVAK